MRSHVLFLLSGVVFIPILLAKTGRVSAEEVEYLAFASILVSGVTTIIQVLRVGAVGSGYVLFMGTSGAFIACTLDAVDQGGLALAAGLAMLSAPLEFLISYFFRFLRKIFTPAVGGVVIMLVAVTIIPITIELWVGEEGTPGAGSRENLLIGLATFSTILGCAVFGGKKVREWGPLLGIGCGYISAALLGHLEMTNFDAAGWFGPASSRVAGNRRALPNRTLASIHCFFDRKQCRGQLKRLGMWWRCRESRSGIFERSTMTLFKGLCMRMG